MLEYWSPGPITPPTLHYSNTSHSLNSPNRSRRCVKTQTSTVPTTNARTGSGSRLAPRLAEPSRCPKTATLPSRSPRSCASERQRHGHLAIRQHADPDPTIEDSGGDQRQDDLPEHTWCRGAGDLAGFFQFAMDLDHDAVGRARAVSDPVDRMSDGDNATVPYTGK